MDIGMDKMDTFTKLIIFYPMVSQSIPMLSQSIESMLSQGIPLCFHKAPIRI